MSGRIIKWRARACSSGPTAGSTSASTSTIRKKAWAPSTGKHSSLDDRYYCIGLMDVSTTDSGSTESRTALAPTRPHLGRPNKDSGRKESASTGFEAQHKKTKYSHCHFQVKNMLIYNMLLLHSISTFETILLL